MWTRVSTLLAWALAAASIVFWGLKLFATANPPPADVQLATAGGPPRGDLTRLLGADAPPPPPPEAQAAAPDPRFHLIGVVSPPSPAASAQGLAVIVVDDKPARAYRVGAVVDGQTVLQSVHARGASLGPQGGAAAVALDLPPPAAAATGQLPAATTLPTIIPRPAVSPGGYRPPSRPVAVPQAAPQSGPQPDVLEGEPGSTPVIPPGSGRSPGFNQAGRSRS